MSVFKDNLEKFLYETGEDTIDKTVLNRPFLAIITALDSIRPYITNMASRLGVSKDIDQAENYPYYDNTHYVNDGDSYKEAISKLDHAAMELSKLILSKADIIGSLNISLSDSDIAVSPETAANNWHLILKQGVVRGYWGEGQGKLLSALASAGDRVLCVSRVEEFNDSHKVQVTWTQNGLDYYNLKSSAHWVDFHLGGNCNIRSMPYSLVRTRSGAGWSVFLLSTFGEGGYCHMCEFYVSQWNDMGSVIQMGWGVERPAMWRRNNDRIGILARRSDNIGVLRYRESQGNSPHLNDNISDWTGWNDVLNLPGFIENITVTELSGGGARGVIELVDTSSGRHDFRFIKQDTIGGPWEDMGWLLPYGGYWKRNPHVIEYPAAEGVLVLSYIDGPYVKVIVSVDDGLNWRFPQNIAALSGDLRYPICGGGLKILSNGTVMGLTTIRSLVADSDGEIRISGDTFSMILEQVI